jgi:hypothetical protein
MGQPDFDLPRYFLVYTLSAFPCPAPAAQNAARMGHPPALPEPSGTGT